VNALRLIAATILTLALTAALAVCSQLPYSPDGRETALVRLSWRAVGERVERCRRATPEELAALPAHMRRPEICEGSLEPFRLSVALNGETIYTGQVRASGAREDRPTYVFREFEVPAGTHHLQIHFAPDREDSARAPLRLDETVTLAARKVLLVTHDPGTDRLSVFSPTS
jgi:hypothetical protein